MGEVVVRGLRVDVGSHRLVDGVDLELRSGTITTLVGPSGAGKSTIAAAVAGTLPATYRVSGTVSRNGRVGYLPQDAASTLNPARRIGTALAELAMLHGDPPAHFGGRRQWKRGQVDDLLRQAAFPPESGRHRHYPSEFSGGQRLRLALAQVLATRPRTLVLDEPTAGLDPVARGELISVLDGLRRDGTAVLVVAHDETVTAELSDRAFAVHDGYLSRAPGSTKPAVPPRDQADTGSTVLELVNSGVRRGSAQLLREASFRVGSREFVGVVGASGAGKTTLARAIAGLERLSTGEVIVGGEASPSLGARSRRQLAQVQYVWQETRESFERARPVLDQAARTAVRLRGSSRADARTEALALLDSFGLTADQARRPPEELSGGQLRRVALVRALLAHPRVLVCDEPTTGLDPAAAESLLDYLDDYRRTHHVAVLVCGHDIRTLLSRVGRILAVDNGAVTDDVTVTHLANTAVSPALHRLLSADGVGELVTATA